MPRIFPTSLRLALVTLAFTVTAVCSNATDKGTVRTRIVLDPTTFPKISRPLLQETADLTAKTVDEMIPEPYPNGASPTILCFVANGEWADKPRAVVGKPWKTESDLHAVFARGCSPV